MYPHQYTYVMVQYPYPQMRNQTYLVSTCTPPIHCLPPPSLLPKLFGTFVALGVPIFPDRTFGAFPFPLELPCPSGDGTGAARPFPFVFADSGAGEADRGVTGTPPPG